MAGQVPVSDEAVAIDQALDRARDDGTHELVPDLAWKRLGIVTVAFAGEAGAGDREWVLIDAGLQGTGGLIRSAAAGRFGEGARPAAIVMTHGHFDHVGALEELAGAWDAPVYAHPLERPYLDGSAAYPPGDPSVGGGMMAWLSRFYPVKPVDVGARLRDLPEDGSVPGMPGWRWLHTPGHSVGHVSLWREGDRLLVAGDAVVTTKQESAYHAAVQDPEMHGPPQYLTLDWRAAGESVARLAALRPETVLTGHGRPLRGPEVPAALDRLAATFLEVAVPARGKYLAEPRRAEDGSAYERP